VTRPLPYNAEVAPVTHVATTDLADMLSPGPERRMPLPGFDAKFVDFPHYIVLITEEIWAQRQVDLCLRYYAPGCVIHTTAGDVVGAQAVVDNTHATLRAFPDRRLDADNVIWSNEGGGAFYSSHLITSKMTNLGLSEFGPATGRKVRVHTIADCLCKDNQVIREWLVRDNAGLVAQLGLEVAAVAQAQAQADRAVNYDLIAHHAEAFANPPPPVAFDCDAARIAGRALLQAWSAEPGGAERSRLYDYRVDALFPNTRRLYGPDDIDAELAEIFAALPDAQITIEHVAVTPFLGGAQDVALRWSLRAHHRGAGRYGAATGAPVYCIGVSQMRMMNGRVREERTVWDDLAVRRQIECARWRGA
jgi:predicted ester cyclase